MKALSTKFEEKIQSKPTPAGNQMDQVLISNSTNHKDMVIAEIQSMLRWAYENQKTPDI